MQSIQDEIIAAYIQVLGSQFFSKIVNSHMNLLVQLNREWPSVPR